MRAIISSTVSSTSDLMTVVSASACRTRVETAFSTSVAARSLRGLKLRLSRAWNSSGSRVSTTASLLVFAVSIDMGDLALFLVRLVLGRRLGAVRHAFLERLHQRRIGQKLLDLVFGGDLAVHVAHQVRELLTRLQEFGERRHLPRDRGRAEVVHLLEAKIDRHLLAGVIAQLVRDFERHARVDRFHARLEIVHVEFEERAIGDIRLLDTGIVARKIGHHAHYERKLDHPLGIEWIFVGDMNAGSTIAADKSGATICCHGWSSLSSSPAPY